jgi:hypothetical protein
VQTNADLLNLPAHPGKNTGADVHSANHSITPPHLDCEAGLIWQGFFEALGLFVRLKLTYTLISSEDLDDELKQTR